MGELLRDRVHNVISFFKFIHQKRQLLRGMLQVIIHRNTGIITGSPYTAERGIMLTEIPGQVKSPDDLRIGTLQIQQSVPAVVRTAVVYQNDLISREQFREYLNQPFCKLGNGAFPVINRYNYRNNRQKI